MNEVDKIKTDLNIKDLGQMTPEQMTALFKGIGNSNYSVASLHAIAPMVPEFSKIAVESLKTLKEIATKAGDVQEKVTDGLNQALRNLDKVASHPNATHETLKLVVEKSAEIAKDIAALGRTWIDFWWDFGKLAATVGTVVAVSIIGYVASNNNDRA